MEAPSLAVSPIHLSQEIRNRVNDYTESCMDSSFFTQVIGFCARGVGELAAQGAAVPSLLFTSAQVCRGSDVRGHLEELLPDIRDVVLSVFVWLPVISGAVTGASSWTTFFSIVGAAEVCALGNTQWISSEEGSDQYQRVSGGIT